MYFFPNLFVVAGSVATLLGAMGLLGIVIYPNPHADMFLVATGFFFMLKYDVLVIREKLGVGE